MKQASRLLVVSMAIFSSILSFDVKAQASSCHDDYGTERCTDESRAKQRLLYKVESAEGFANKKVQLVRAFFVDGYGQDVAMVAFKRAPGEDLQVEVRLPDRGGERANPRMVGLLSSKEWTGLVADAGSFDRDLVPLPEKTDEMSICLHSWLSVVEVVDERGRVRRKASSACGRDSLVNAYAFKIARMAVESFPFCTMLSSEASRNDVTRLVDCWKLRGDRAAAAQAYNRLHTRWFLNPNGTDFARSLQELFFDRAELTWPGEVKVTGAALAAQLWTAKASENRFIPQIYFGEMQGRVRIEGEIWPRPKSDADKPKPIPATMLWTKENGFDFRLHSLSPKRAD